MSSYTPGLFGERLPAREVHDLIYRHGWTEPLNMTRMVAVLNAESNLYTKAVGTVNANGTQDFGLFQLNNGHYAKFGYETQGDFIDAAYDPEKAAEIARTLWRENQKAGGTGFGPWAAYTSGAFTKYLPYACTGLCNFAAVRLIGKQVI